jgi:alanine-synthesizing transaminase
MEFRRSSKLARVSYEIRRPGINYADQLEQAGHQVFRLNIGNPAMFGFEVPEEILRDMIRDLPGAHTYTDSRGLLSARLAVVRHYRERGLPDVDVDDVFLGNGVSELLTMATAALLEDGDEVLIPAPDYPLWTSATHLAGGRAVHYMCDEAADWLTDLADMAAKVTERTRAVLIINPHNPTGAVYPREVLDGILDIARRHHLVVFADEIYDQIVFDDAVHLSAAALAADVLCLTFSGLSKAYRAGGFRSGWMVISGPRQHAKNYIEGLDALAGLRMCPNVPGQYALLAALGAKPSVTSLVLPGGRLREQRDRAWQKLTEIPGVSCVKPRGAMYAFPRLDPAVHQIRDDGRFALDLLLREKVQVIQGTGFHWPRPDHFRILTLPDVDYLDAAIGRIARFLEGYRQ